MHSNEDAKYLIWFYTNLKKMQSIYLSHEYFLKKTHSNKIKCLNSNDLVQLSQDINKATKSLDAQIYIIFSSLVTL